MISGIILDVWQALVGWYPTIALDHFVIMLNHIHFIMWLQSTVVGAISVVAQWAGASPAPTDWIIPQGTRVNLRPTLGNVVGTFKSLVFTVYLAWIEAHQLQYRAKFWQKNYYEHVIRSETELLAIRQYIRDNPQRWVDDRDNPNNLQHLPPPTSTEDYLEEAQLLMANQLKS